MSHEYQIRAALIEMRGRDYDWEDEAWRTWATFPHLGFRSVSDEFCRKLRDAGDEDWPKDLEEGIDTMGFGGHHLTFTHDDPLLAMAGVEVAWIFEELFRKHGNAVRLHIWLEFA